MFYFIVIFYGFATDIDWIERMSFSNRTKRRFYKGFCLFVCLILNVFVQINIKEINGRAVLAKHAKIVTPSEVRWEKIFLKNLYFYLIYPFPKAKYVEMAPSRYMLMC